MDTKFPISPINGQVFVDQYNVSWVYSAIGDGWCKLGLPDAVPLATAEPKIIGLMNSLDKKMLDRASDGMGSFGIMLKPGAYLTEENGLESYFSGDVNLISNSLTFTCSDAPKSMCAEDRYMVLAMSINSDLIDAFCVESTGGKGPKGDPGNAGLPGKHGVGDGPMGDQGPPGVDGTPMPFGGIITRNTNNVSPVGVVRMELDQEKSQLSVIKSPLKLPNNNSPADKVATSFSDIDIVFNDGWEFTIPSINLLKIPHGYSDGNIIPVTPVDIRTVIQSMISVYQTKTNEISAGYDKLIYDYLKQKDIEARNILASLAQELAQCQFQLPLEFCVGFKQQQCVIPELSASQPSATVSCACPDMNVNPPDSAMPTYGAEIAYGVGDVILVDGLEIPVARAEQDTSGIFISRGQSSAAYNGQMVNWRLGLLKQVILPTDQSWSRPNLKCCEVVKSITPGDYSYIGNLTWRRTQGSGVTYRVCTIKLQVCDNGQICATLNITYSEIDPDTNKVMQVTKSVGACPGGCECDESATSINPLIDDNGRLKAEWVYCPTDDCDCSIMVRIG